LLTLSYSYFHVPKELLVYLLLDPKLLNIFELLKVTN
jgi:hypothetical protein